MKAERSSFATSSPTWIDTRSALATGSGFGSIPGHATTSLELTQQSIVTVVAALDVQWTTNRNRSLTLPHGKCWRACKRSLAFFNIFRYGWPAFYPGTGSEDASLLF